MKYAVVYKDIEDQTWATETWSNSQDLVRHDFPTHAAALAHALAEVGLIEKNTEKETSR